jgi:RNA polymerase sigma factor (sigma-70 family)
MESDTAAVPTPELAVVFSALAPRLTRSVRGRVQGPEEVIDDACQSAWTLFADHADRLEGDRALAWLTTTAYREAFRITRREQRELSLDALAEALGGVAELPFPAPGADPHELLEQRERIDQLRALPRRQGRILWLRAAGHSYAELARSIGCTRRTIDRQLLRGRQRMRAMAADD